MCLPAWAAVPCLLLTPKHSYSQIHFLCYPSCNIYLSDLNWSVPSCSRTSRCCHAVTSAPLSLRPPSQILTPFTSVQAGNNLRFRHFPYKLHQHLITSDSPLPTPFCCRLWRFSGVSVRSPSDQRIQLQICC